jgi:hypothetical protein
MPLSSRLGSIGGANTNAAVAPRQVPSIAADPSNEKVLFWNPAGASFEKAMAVLGTPDGSAGVIGGTDVSGCSWLAGNVRQSPTDKIRSLKAAANVFRLWR